MQGVPSERYQKIFKKSGIVPKKNKRGPFGLPSTFGSILKFCGLERDSNPRSPASQTQENYPAKKLNKSTKKWADRVELTKKTSHCKSRAVSSKSPTKNSLCTC